jgi:hypothetical protein
LDINKYQEELNKLKDVAFDRKIKMIFGDELISQDLIDYDGRDPKKMKFLVSKNHKIGSIVPLVFAYDHI